jgi:DNA polymerase-3 subunit beta
MKLQTTKENLLEGIQKVQNIINPKSTLPILSHILLDSYDNKLFLTTTDLDIGVSTYIKVETQEPGTITIPAKRFSDIIKELTEKTITITSKKNNVIYIETTNCQFKLIGLSKDEFPKLPEFKDKEVIQIEQGVLKELINLTFFAISHDETRYVLNGELLEIKDKRLRLVATDGRRLATASRELLSNTAREAKEVLPSKTIQELLRNLKEEGTLSMVIGDNQVLFEFENTMLVSRLIEGEFPDYQQVIPPAVESKIKIDRDGFLQALRRAALLATPEYQAVKMELFKNKLVVSKSTPDLGESREEIPVEYGGKEIAIGFNPYYLLDFLKNFPSQAVEMELTTSDKPAVVRLAEYVYIVLPMRLQ